MKATPRLSGLQESPCFRASRRVSGRQAPSRPLFAPKSNPPTDLAGSRESAVLSDPTSRSVL
jgi:hypothetical protein